MNTQTTPNKLIQLLSVLSLKETKAFKNFLDGFHPKQNIQHAVFEYLFQFAPTFRSVEQLTIDRIYEAVFQKAIQSPKDRKNLLNAFSDLTRWLEDFLLHEKLKEKSAERTLLLQRVYQERGLVKNHANAVEKSYEASLAQEEQFLEQFLLNEAVYFGTNKEAESRKVSHLVEGLTQLSSFYTVKALQYTNELANRRKVLSGLTQSPHKIEDLQALLNSYSEVTDTH